MSVQASDNGVDDDELAHIPPLVRGFISKFPRETLKAIVEYGILDNLGYKLVKKDDQ